MGASRFWTLTGPEIAIGSRDWTRRGESPRDDRKGGRNGGGGGGDKPDRGRGGGGPGGGGPGKGGGGGGGGGFTPLDLSAGAGLKFWVEADDLSTMWQDTSATTPVASDDDPIALWQDKSGNGHDVKLLGGWIVEDRPHYRTSGGLHWADYAQRSVSAGSRLSSADLAFKMFDATGGWVAIAYETRNAESLFALLGEQVSATDFRQIQLWADTRATPNRFAVKNTGAGDVYIDYPAEQAADVRTAIMNNESGTLTGYKDGSALASTMAAGTLSGTTRLDLGWRRGDHGSKNLDGKIFAALAGDGTLNVTDIANLTTYLMGKAGI